MKLNPDCLRDLLMYFEAETKPNHLVSFTANGLRNKSEKLAGYTADELLYHIEQCSASGFLIQYAKDLSGNLLIADISPKAHEFLANIRDDTLWGKTKGIAREVGSASLSALGEIAAGVVSAIVQKKLGL